MMNLEKIFNCPSSKTSNDSDVAIEIIEILTQFINSDKWSNAEELIDLIKKEGKQIVGDSQGETIVLNTILRVLKIIREEAVRILKGAPEFEENLTNDLFAHGYVAYNEVLSENLQEPVSLSIEELRSEISQSLMNIANQSLWHIHSNEIIFTVGYSRDVFHFLKYAADNGRKFQVMIAECSPENHGHQMALELEKIQINVILVPDSHSFAVMSRVNKVILSCHTVYTDSGMRAVVGTHGVMLAAQKFSVPIYVCLPPYKVSPKCFNLKSLDWLDNPGGVLEESFEDINLGNYEALNPKWDYIPQGLVSLFITNLAGNAPSYIYAMVREFFHREDIQDALCWDE